MIEVWQGTEIDLQQPSSSVSINPNIEEIINVNLMALDKGAYIRISFNNQYGVSHKDFVVGEDICIENSELPNCGA